MRRTFGSVESVMLMHESWVVICQYYRPCLAPLCSAVILYISHHMTALEAKRGASIHGSLFEMIVVLP